MDHRQQVVTGLGAFADQLEQMPQLMTGADSSEVGPIQTHSSSPNGQVTVTVKHRQIDRLDVVPELLEQGWAAAGPIIEATINAALLEHDQVTMAEYEKHSMGFDALAKAVRQFRADVQFHGGGQS